MLPTPFPPPSAALLESTGLLERWRDESVASVWRRPSDWYHPAVDELAVAILLHDDAVAAAARLGSARGDAGVGVAEAIDDLGCLYRTTGAGEPPLPVVRALCTGWADAQAAPVGVPWGRDPESGLPSAEYLRIRLAECYPAATDRLLVVDVAAGVPDPFTRAARSAAVGAALLDAFGPARPMASLGGGAFVVLSPADERPDDALVVLDARVTARTRAGRVTDVTRHPLRRWSEGLPPTYDEAVRRLDALARP
nr:hypothetical protein [Cellulomonas fulva]